MKKREKKQTKRAYFDTEDNSETISDVSQRRVTQVCAVDDSDCWHCSDNVEALLTWFEENKITHAYAHNLQYDLGNLFGDCLDDLDLLTAGSRIIRAKYKGITFLDTSNMFGPVKLASIGKIFGLEKLERDLSGWDYVKRDVEIVRKGVQYWNRFVESYGVEKIPATLSGAAVKVWQAMGGDNWYCDDDLAHKALYGGRVEVFDTAGEAGIYSYYDFNSLYPWSMTGDFATESRRLRDITEHCVADVTITVPESWCPPLPYRGKDGLYFPFGTWRGVYVGLELLNAIENGCTVQKIHSCHGSKQGRKYYAEFIEHFYSKRVDATSESDKLMFKIFMNGLYGQLGMSGSLKRTRPLAEYDFDKEGDYIGTGIPFGAKVLDDMELELPSHVNYIHAATVTARARVKLHKLMISLKGKLCYCDTDSVFVRLQKEEHPVEVGKGLGCLKHEGFANHAEFIAPKLYTFGDKAAAKGVPQQLAFEFIEKGFAEFKKPTKLMTALKAFDLSSGPRLSVWETKTRTRRKGYSKKTQTRKGYKPLCVNQIKK